MTTTTEKKPITVDLFSQTSYFLECKKDDTILAKGTCFFIKREDKFYLITNWHNATGQNPLDKTYLGQYAINPNKFVVKVFKNQQAMEWTDLEVMLVDSNNNKLWLEHPVYAEKVDVIAIEVNIPSDKLVLDIERFIEPFNEDTNVEIKDDVFVLGFPFGLKAGGNLPIWKRASIASEPVLNIDDLPKIYVDTATRPGMSGSPVIYKEKRPVIITDTNPNFATKVSRHFMKFIGIYSGRIGSNDELSAQLGIVWKSEAIEEIIKG
ncbi:MAG: trypsin-like peptidase domain-containing protein [Bacteroidetes bacterium]|nr:trypsin-like peptidase domain-containing protein [Bacteroidota bacterium]